jgi:type IV pilus assembly protein PilB
MGVPSFLIASTLNISIAQRLVRKLCSDCKTKKEVSPDLFPTGFIIPKELHHHYEPVGCQECYHTGYLGRKAIYELIPINKTVAEFIKKNQLSIDDYLQEHKVCTLKENALSLIKDGTTSIEEVFSLLMD